MLDWAKSIITQLGYPGIAILMLVENIFPPIPSEIIMPFAGFASEKDQLTFLGVVLSGTVGSVLGTIPFYLLGAKIGTENLKQWVARHGHWIMLAPEDIARAQQWFDRHDKKAVLFCRLVPGLRTLISIPAGVERMNFGTFILLSLLGTGLWVGMLTYLGRLLGRHYAQVSTYINPASYIVIGGLLLSYVIYVLRHKRG